MDQMKLSRDARSPRASQRTRQLGSSLFCHCRGLRKRGKTRSDEIEHPEKGTAKAGRLNALAYNNKPRLLHILSLRLEAPFIHEANECAFGLSSASM